MMLPPDSATMAAACGHAPAAQLAASGGRAGGGGPSADRACGQAGGRAHLLLAVHQVHAHKGRQLHQLQATPRLTQGGLHVGSEPVGGDVLRRGRAGGGDLDGCIHPAKWCCQPRRPPNHAWRLLSAAWVGSSRCRPEEGSQPIRRTSLPLIVCSSSSPNRPSCFSLTISSTTLRSESRADDCFFWVVCRAESSASRSMLLLAREGAASAETILGIGGGAGYAAAGSRGGGRPPPSREPAAALASVVGARGPAAPAPPPPAHPYARPPSSHVVSSNVQCAAHACCQHCGCCQRAPTMPGDDPRPVVATTSGTCTQVSACSTSSVAGAGAACGAHLQHKQGGAGACGPAWRLSGCPAAWPRPGQEREAAACCHSAVTCCQRARPSQG